MAKECPTCGPGPQRKIGLRGGRYQRWNLGVETTIVACAKCGLVFPNPFPIPQDPQRLYGDPTEYFNYDSSAKLDYTRAIARGIIERAGSKNVRVLDVGAGRGDFIQGARSEGIEELVGIELSDAMVAAAKKEFGVELIRKTIEELADTKPKPFDVIVLNAVLEHVYDPDSMIRAVASMIAARGVVYIDIPRDPNLTTIIGNLSKRLVGSEEVYNLQPTWEPFHVFGFTPTSLRTLLEKHGFVIEELKCWERPGCRHDGTMKDRFVSGARTQLARVANATGLAGNMFVWARKS